MLQHIDSKPMHIIMILECGWFEKLEANKF